MLEGVTNGERLLWFMYFGLPGSLKDIKVFNKFPSMGKIL